MNEWWINREAERQKDTDTYEHRFVRTYIRNVCVCI